MGPSVIRIAGLNKAISRVGFQVEDAGNVHVRTPESIKRTNTTRALPAGDYFGLRTACGYRGRNRLKRCHPGNPWRGSFDRHRQRRRSCFAF